MYTMTPLKDVCKSDDAFSLPALWVRRAKRTVAAERRAQSTELTTTNWSHCMHLFSVISHEKSIAALNDPGEIKC
jgi:hypothetical protein